ncbi:hypothetical protein [Rufibacter psychrotolerans]|uniref:hypothetical protein n=1 Tax=Rufibacter psychrotolerans TaxID=2812556 RepID=UPI0019688F74|nr:hypothetical protein [Rufibacter sp. SYSU D00308]
MITKRKGKQMLPLSFLQAQEEALGTKAAEATPPTTWHHCFGKGFRKTAVKHPLLVS